MCGNRRIYKVYKQISEEGASTLLDFYKETRLIRFLEKGTLEEKYDGAGRVAFSLSPVGWERRPRTTAEVKVRHSHGGMHLCIAHYHHIHSFGCPACISVCG